MIAFPVDHNSRQCGAVSQDIAERIGLITNIDVIGIRKGLNTLRPRLLQTQHVEVLGLRNREGPNQPPVDHAENRGVHSEAQAQSYDLR